MQRVLAVYSGTILLKRKAAEAWQRRAWTCSPACQQLLVWDCWEWIKLNPQPLMKGKGGNDDNGIRQLSWDNGQAWALYLVEMDADGRTEKGIEASASGHRQSVSSPFTSPPHTPTLTRAIVSFIIIMSLFVLFPPGGQDWDHFFQPAALSMGYSEGVFNPPWLFPLLLPLAWLPSHTGAAALAAITLVVLIEYVKDWYKVLALLLSAPVLATFYYGQIDVIPLLALLMPAWCSLPLLAIKPQGVFLAALRRLTPTSIAFLLTVLALSFLIWGFWPLDIVGTPDGPHNRSLFPWSLGITIGILAWLRTHDSEHADGLLCLASLAASPYWAIHSMLPMTTLFTKKTSRVGCVAICAATWAYAFLGGIYG